MLILIHLTLLEHMAIYFTGLKIIMSIFLVKAVNPSNPFVNIISNLVPIFLETAADKRQASTFISIPKA